MQKLFEIPSITLFLCAFCAFLWLKNPFHLLSTKVYVRNYILFLQNEPKFRKSQMNVNNAITMDYEQLDTWSIGKNEPKRTQNEPKRTQNEPKSKKAKMNVTSIITKGYENISNWAICENEPNSNPIYRGVASGEAGTNPVSAPLFGSVKIIRIKGKFYLTYIHRAAMYRLLIFYFGDTKLAISKDLIAASASPLVLSILSQGENYGYAIIKHVRELSGGKMQWTDGMLYPVLHRLENQGLIKSHERISETGRKRRYYRIEDKGTTVLKEQRNQWMLVYSTLKQLWENEPCLT